MILGFFMSRLLFIFLIELTQSGYGNSNRDSESKMPTEILYF